MKKTLFHLRKNHRKNSLLAFLALVLITTGSWIYNHNLITSASPEISLASVSPTGESKGAVVAASCGFNGFGDSNAPHYIGDTMCGGTCPAGSIPTNNCPPGEGMVSFNYNGSIVYYCSNIYTSCGSDKILDAFSSNNNFITASCTNKPQNVRVCNGFCTNGASNYPSCNSCPAGQMLMPGVVDPMAGQLYNCQNPCPTGASASLSCPSGYTLTDTSCASNVTTCMNNKTCTNRITLGSSSSSGSPNSLPILSCTCAGGSNPTYSCASGTLSGTNCVLPPTCPTGLTLNNGWCSLLFVPISLPTQNTVPATSSCNQDTCSPGTGWNTATNSCTTCSANQITQNNQCVTCPAGKMPDVTKTSCVDQCANGATNYPTCTCASNQTLINGVCTNNCTNGAINPGACNLCQTPQFRWNGNSCVPNTCGNMIPPANYGQSCSGGTNACGQNTTTGTIQCDGTCSAQTNNNSCIQTFIPNTTSVYPNGSVEFAWKVLPGADGLKPVCGFYDRSKNNGVGLGTPIPGLQNLDPDLEKLRINNIQRNTEFCLVCVYAPVSGTPQAPAALHQWVRVIRIGEN